MTCGELIFSNETFATVIVYFLSIVFLILVDLFACDGYLYFKFPDFEYFPPRKYPCGLWTLGTTLLTIALIVILFTN